MFTKYSAQGEEDLVFGMGHLNVAVLNELTFYHMGRKGGRKEEKGDRGGREKVGVEGRGMVDDSDA